MKVKITDFVNQSQFTMKHIPVHVVLFIDKHPPETNHVWPTDSTSMCKDFSYENTSNEQNSFQRVSLSTKQFTKHNTWIVRAIF